MTPDWGLLPTAYDRDVRAPTWQSFGGDHRLMRHALNVWPPFAASGIRVERIGADFRTARVALHHR